MSAEEITITDGSALIAKNSCSNCGRLLNVSPIFCIEVNNISKKICGRCNHIVNKFKGKKYRQQTFEDLAEHLTYPCSNKQYGCDCVSPWVNVVAHEKVCKFQYISCVFSHGGLFPGKECNWVGNVGKFDEHILTSHKECVFGSSKIQVQFEGLVENKIFFALVSKKLITVIIIFENLSKYNCIVMTNGNDLDSQCYQYQLELFTEGKKEKSVLLRKDRLEQLGCLSTNLKTVDKQLEIDLCQIKNILGSAQNICGCFGIVRKKNKLLKQIIGENFSSVKDKTLPLDESVLQELECPVCNQYLITKIFICHAGHSICSNCRERVASCPICRSEFSITRNYTLEKLTSKIHYPCRNREIGCSFVTTADKIRNHEVFCELTEISCLLLCGHKCLRPKLLAHILEKHSHYVLELDVVHKRDITVKHTSYILHDNGELFRFGININNDYKFSVHHLGTTDEPIYRYRLEFVDPSPCGPSISMGFVCRSLTESPEQMAKSKISIQSDLMKPFHDGKYLLYKISICKI